MVSLRQLRRPARFGALRCAMVVVATVIAVVGTATGASPSATFPARARDALGNRVTVRAQPRRIVSLAPAMTEILYALGLDREIVGVTNYCDYPAGARTKPKVGGITNPSLERVLALRPDLVIGMRLNPKPLFAALARAGVPAYAADPQTIDEVTQTIAEVGALCGRRAQGDALARRLSARVAAVRRRVSGHPAPRVVVVFQQDPLWVAGRSTFPDHLIRLAQGRNVAGDLTGYRQYSVERLLAGDPDAVILTSMSTGKETADLRVFIKRPALRGLAAVRGHRVYVINADLVDRAGPRIVEGLEQLAALLHPASPRSR